MNKKILYIKKTHRTAIALLGVFFLFFDQVLKWYARSYPEFAVYIVKPWIGWEYFENTGVAFGLPVPQAALLLMTPLLLFGFIVWVMRQQGRVSLAQIAGVSLLVSGAISNFVDRVLYSVTIDYIRIWTSVLNVADIMIVVGAVLVFFGERGVKTQR